MPYQPFNTDPQFKPPDNIYENRLRQFIDANGEYAHMNLPALYDIERFSNDSSESSSHYINLSCYKGFGQRRPLFKEAIFEAQGQWETIHKGDSFGPSWTTVWVKVEIKIPKKWVGQPGIQLEWDCNNEGMVYTVDGKPLTAYSGGGERIEFIIPDTDKQQEFTFYIEMANNGMFGVGLRYDYDAPDPNRYFNLSKADLVLPNLEAHALHYDFWIIGDAARELPGDSWQKHKARAIANEIMDTFDLEDPDTIAKCRAIAATYLGKDVDSSKVYHTKRKEFVEAFSIGNCHIDTAWLWPFAETRRKVARSWASQITLMERYPEYNFVASQVQQFKWLKQDHPEFFNGPLKEKVAEGQFIPIGGSWVENDTNVPSGESLSRQFLYGQRFFEREFGMRTKVFWLPDTFGYTAQIPQIVRLSGMDKFLTQKLSWNNINSFPNSTFNWVAPDGSQVLTHMPPNNTYTALADFGDVLRTTKQHKNLTQDQVGLLLFGKGDGGGGPTSEMLEKQRRIRGASNTVGNVIPRVNVDTSVDKFYDAILKNTNDGKKLVSWTGELYFEFHRGTYTTQSDIKKYMRKGEIALHDLEWFATQASLTDKRYSYPATELNDLWEDLLLCQFHDVLPGSSIEMVYDDAKPMLRNVIATTNKLIKRALKHLPSGGSTTALPWKIADVKSAVHASSEHDSFILKSQKLKVTVSKKTGVITSLYDLVKDREVLDTKTGRNKTGANQFVLFDDKPLSWQAWDTEIFSTGVYKNLNASEVSLDDTTIVVTVPVDKRCHITSRISLANDQVNINTKISNWDVECKFLKVEFPVDINAPNATYESQFGYTQRPTHFNTSWDVAKFEVPCHKYVDYSEATYGVSILNDSKYGFATHGNLMRLSLVRAPKAPDRHADMGDHEINYAIFPHAGGLSMETVRRGFEFNYPTYNVSAEPIVQWKGDENVVLSNIKRGEDDFDTEYSFRDAKNVSADQSIIVRLYDALGGKARGKVVSSLPVKKAFLTNNIEDELEEIPVHEVNGEWQIAVNMRSFEIKCLKLVV